MFTVSHRLKMNKDVAHIVHVQSLWETPMNQCRITSSHNSYLSHGSHWRNTSSPANVNVHIASGIRCIELDLVFDKNDNIRVAHTTIQASGSDHLEFYLDQIGLSNDVCEYKYYPLFIVFDIKTSNMNESRINELRSIVERSVRNRQEYTPDLFSCTMGDLRTKTCIITDYPIDGVSSACHSDLYHSNSTANKNTTVDATSMKRIYPHWAHELFGCDEGSRLWDRHIQNGTQILSMNMQVDKQTQKLIYPLVFEKLFVCNKTGIIYPIRLIQ